MSYLLGHGSIGCTGRHGPFIYPRLRVYIQLGKESPYTLFTSGLILRPRHFELHDLRALLISSNPRLPPLASLAP